MRVQSKAGNPIRRPPNSGTSGISESSGYSSTFDSGYSSIETDEYDDTDRPLVPNRNTYSRRAPINNEQVQIARLILAIACFWPLLFLLIPPSTSKSHIALLSTDMDAQSFSQHIKSIEQRTHNKIDNLRYKVSNNISAKKDYIRNEMKSLLKRTDVVGYGKSQPRVAVVVVVPPATTDNYKIIEENELLNGALKAVESVFRTTDRNRIFVVTVVMDGRGKTGTFESKLQDIDQGRTAHRHGTQTHAHDQHHDWLVDGHSKKKKSNEEKEDHAHSEKIHTIYNHESIGVSASRKEAVQFINILSSKHEEAGIKSQDEELLLLFLRCDAQLVGGEKQVRTWLDDVTDALILTSPEEDTQKEKKDQLAPANAVSFVVDYSSTDTEGNIEVHSTHLGDTFSFDDTLHPVHATASGQDMALTNGESYPTPLTNAATALRLSTYNAFPASDEMLVNHYSADLELAFNLWLCADGIDILGSSNARVVVSPDVLNTYEKSTLPGPLAARIVSAWMDGHENESFANRIFKSVADSAATTWQHKMESGQNTHNDQSSRILSEKTLEFANMLIRISSEAKSSHSFPIDLAKKCRPFSWYMENVHPKGLDDTDTQSAVVINNQHLLPSHPLSDENMAIISKASPVKLAYEDVSGGHIAHPHKGATDENGKFGYVHDEAALRMHPPPFKFKDDNEHKRLCKGGDPNYKMLTEKVYVDLTSHEAAERRAEHGQQKKKRAKIFCLVYTIEKFHDRIQPIRETWGQKCDGFMVGSTKTDRELGTVNIVHEGPEE